MDNNQDLYKTLESYQKSLELFGKLKNNSIAAKKLLDMGNVYKELKDHEKAVESYNVAYKLYRDEKDISGQAITLKFIADLYNLENSFSEARRYYKRALKKFHTIKDYQMEKKILKLISSCYQAEGALEDAINVEKIISKHNFEDESKNAQLSIRRLERLTFDVWPTRKQSYFLFFFIMVMIIAELMITYYSLYWGIILNVFLIVSLIITSTLSSLRFSYLSQAMILLPFIRIMSLIVPAIGIQALYWPLIMLIPILVAIIIIMHSQNLNLKNVGINSGKNLKLQLGIGLSGLILGYIEYQIIQPTALISSFNPANIILASLIIIISTGFLEELIFRGLIQRNAENLVGKFWGVIFASVLSTVLNIGWNSFIDITFIFLVSIIYGYIFQKTRSILGLGISHGLCNVILFIILPFL